MFVYGAARRRVLNLDARTTWRAVLSSMVMLACLLSLALPAEAKARLSAIVVDARTGKVLSSVDPDGSRHPASLTKMMTLYLLFQDLKAGKIKLDSPIRMSARAAGMAPSKLGVKAGKSITVETAIKALVVKSANDVAAAVAENLGGTESAFAERMTRTARSIGMKRTTFRNASGLPNPAQVTTARDMATLGLRLQRDFPQYYPYFRARTFTYGGKTIKGHNRLLGNFEGTDGIKTGYINASGFNLVTSTRRGSKRLVGVVIGGKTGASRDAYMRNILEKNFAKGSNGKTIAALAGSSKGAIDPGEAAPEAAVAETETKAPEPDTGSLAALADASAGDAGDDEAAATIKTVSAPEKTKKKKAAAPEVVEGTIAQPAELPFEVKAEASQAEVAPDATPDTAEGEQVVAALAADVWHIQIGSFETKEDATARLLKLRETGPKVLHDKQGFTVTIQKGQKTTYRARFSGFSEKSARETCQEFARRNTSCYVEAPSS